jgi:hypothetical protein
VAHRQLRLRANGGAEGPEGGMGGMGGRGGRGGRGGAPGANGVYAYRGVDACVQAVV